MGLRNWYIKRMSETLELAENNPEASDFWLYMHLQYEDKLKEYDARNAA